MVQIRALGNNKAVRGITTPTMMYQPRDERDSVSSDRQGQVVGPHTRSEPGHRRGGGGGCWEGAAYTPCGRHTAHTSDDSQSPNHPPGPLGMGKLNHPSHPSARSTPGTLS